MVSVDIKHHVYLHTYLLPSDAATNESYRQQWGGKAARKQNKEQIQKCAAMWVNHDNYDNNCSDNVYSKHLICGWAMKYHRAQRQSETVSMSHVDFLKFWEEEKNKKIDNSWGCCVWVDRLDPEPHVRSLIPFRSLVKWFPAFLSLFFQMTSTEWNCRQTARMATTTSTPAMCDWAWQGRSSSCATSPVRVRWPPHWAISGKWCGRPAPTWSPWLRRRWSRRKSSATSTGRSPLTNRWKFVMGGWKE